MPITIIHATCNVCREMLPPTDVLQHGEGYAHAACIMAGPSLTLVPESYLPLGGLRLDALLEAALTLGPKEPALSPTTAHVLVTQSPLKAWWRKFGGAPKEYTDPTEFGNLCHSLLLGGAEIVGIDADDWRTRKAQADREEARAAGKIPVLIHKLRAAEEVAADVRAKLKRRGYDLTTGERELDLTWREGNVLCRGRIDWWNAEQCAWLDLKFVADASMEACVRHMLKYGAAIQHAGYMSALEKRHPDLAGRIQGKFAFFEADPPSDFCIRPVGGTMRSVGRSRWSRAVRIWQSCLEQYGGDPETPWPGLDQDESDMEAPNWALELEASHMEVSTDVPF